MAATKYSKHVQHNTRRAGMMSRHEYCQRSRELAARGEDLPQAKLTEADVMDIRSAKKQREALLQHIRDNLSNDAMARKHGVTRWTIEKIICRETWSHIA